MRRLFLIGLMLGVLVVCGSNWASGQDADAKAPDTVEVITAPLRVVESVETRVESKSNTIIKIDAQTWTDFKVSKVVPQGSLVAAGDVILELKSKEFETKLKDVKFEWDLAKIALEDAKLEFEFYQRAQKIDREIAERDWKQIQDDTKYYFDVQRPIAERQLKQSLQNSAWQVENAQEELDQLVKMYTADELTEESEKIVLKRAERALAQSQFYLEVNEVSTKRELEVNLPRMVQSKESALIRAQLDYEKKSIEFPRIKERKVLELAKVELAFLKKNREYDNLKRDAELMQIKAPKDGVVYHGYPRRGNWTKGATPSLRVIEVDDSVTPGLPVLTLVDLNSLQLRGELEQSLRLGLQAGSQLVARFPGMDIEPIPGELVSSGDFPLDDGKYDAVFELAKFPPGIVPGMNCKISLVVYNNAEALMVPRASVFSDDEGLSHYVHVWKDGKAEKRDVNIGRDKIEMVEVLRGLVAGERVLKSKPE